MSLLSPKSFQAETKSESNSEKQEKCQNGDDTKNTVEVGDIVFVLVLTGGLAISLSIQIQNDTFYLFSDQIHILSKCVRHNYNCSALNLVVTEQLSPIF